MGFKCTIIDLPNIVSRFKEYYDWAGFESIAIDIDNYVSERN